MAKVSIIVPVYNTEKYLDKCLNSLVNQTLKDIEIIVVNDESPDNSQKIIDKYNKKYKNIKSYIKKNGGLSDARNFGIKKATCEYIVFIDSDDYVDITLIEKLYNHAIDNKLDIVVCNSAMVYEDSDKQITLESNLGYSNDNVKNYLISRPAAWNKIFKKELFDDISFKKGIYYEDLELTPKLVKNTKKIGFISDTLYFYLQRGNSIMHQSEFNEKLLDIFKVLESNKKELLNEYPEEIEYMHITHLLRTATLRFLDYEDTYKYLDKINNIMKNDFPNWKENIYFKKSSWKLRLLCKLAYKKQYSILKLIKKLFEQYV